MYIPKCGIRLSDSKSHRKTADLSISMSDNFFNVNTIAKEIIYCVIKRGAFRYQKEIFYSLTQTGNLLDCLVNLSERKSLIFHVSWIYRLQMCNLQHAHTHWTFIGYGWVILFLTTTSKRCIHYVSAQHKKVINNNIPNKYSVSA